MLKREKAKVKCYSCNYSWWAFPLIRGSTMEKIYYTCPRCKKTLKASKSVIRRIG